MTYADAAIDILKQEDRPMHYREITDFAIDQEKLDHIGQQPYQTMNARLAMLSRMEESERLIEKVRPGVYQFNKYSPKLYDHNEDFEASNSIDPPLVKSDEVAEKEQSGDNEMLKAEDNNENNELSMKSESGVDESAEEISQAAEESTEEDDEISAKQSFEEELEFDNEEESPEPEQGSSESADVANEDTENSEETAESPETPETDAKKEDTSEDSSEEEVAGETEVAQESAQESDDVEGSEDTSEKSNKHPRLPNFYESMFEVLKNERKPIPLRKLAQKIYTKLEDSEGLSVANLIHQFQEEYRDKKWETIHYYHGKVTLKQDSNDLTEVSEDADEPAAPVSKKETGNHGHPEKPRIKPVYLSDEVDRFFLKFQDQTRKMLKSELVRLDSHDFQSACQAMLSLSGCEDIFVRPKISGSDLTFLMSAPLESSNGLAVGYRGNSFNELKSLIRQLKLNLTALGLKYAYLITLMDNLESAQQTVDDECEGVHITLVSLDKMAGLFQKAGVGVERHTINIDVVHKEKLFQWLRTFS